MWLVLAKATLLLPSPMGKQWEGFTMHKALGLGSWAGRRRGGCGTHREEAGHQQTQCGQSCSGELKIIGNMFPSCWFPPGLQAEECRGGFWQRVCMRLYRSTAKLKGEMRQRQTADPSNSRAGITPLGHELWAMMFAS